MMVRDAEGLTSKNVWRQLAGVEVARGHRELPSRLQGRRSQPRLRLHGALAYEAL
jgi:hypothetical protein